MKKAIIICFKNPNINKNTINSLINFFQLFSNGQTDFFICFSLEDFDNLKNDNFNSSLEKTLNYLKDENFQIINIISLFLFSDSEFKKLIKIVDSYSDCFLEISLSDPILFLNKDYYEFAEQIINLSNFQNLEKQKIILLGSDETEDSYNYEKLQKAFSDLNDEKYHIISDTNPSQIDLLINNLKSEKIQNIYILPLGLFNEDLEEENFKNFKENFIEKLKNNSINSEFLPIGLAELKSIQELLINRLIRSSNK